jgi:hypothetical protein
MGKIGKLGPLFESFDCGKSPRDLEEEPRNCAKCGQKHHTSLCDNEKSTVEKEQSKLSTENTVKQSVEKNMSSCSNSTTLHPTVKQR